MKNYFLILLFIFLLPINSFAANRIYSINVDILLEQSGRAIITETWDVNGSDGTEWYKAIDGYYKENISNFSVTMDGNPLTYKNWDVNESLKAKAGYYGINETYSGVELCIGKKDYKRHSFEMRYTLDNIVYTVDDADVIYFNFIDRLSNVKFDNFSLKIRGFYTFPDTLDVWGFGYKGYAYVNNGIISMSNSEDEKMNDKYVVLLAKFPKNTFNGNNPAFPEMSTFDEILSLAQRGTFEYDYSEKDLSLFENIARIIGIGIFILPYYIVIKSCITRKYGYKDNKKISKKNTNMFREIPCNKDIYYADTLIYLNEFGYRETNILGAIILKWVREDKIKFITTQEGLLKKEKNALDLTMNPTFNNDIENKLFNVMYEASKDGILESKELEKWCKNNYTKFYKIFDERLNNNVKELENASHIRKRVNKKECKSRNVMDDFIYEESTKLWGLKLFLDNFSDINSKEVIEVKMWDEYLMFAYLFGIADKVASQLKNLYPELLQQENIDYDTIIFVNNISTSSTRAASSARSAAESYSSGGGGFSSGGGGGGSFGGGGGGSR